MLVANDNLGLSKQEFLGLRFKYVAMNGDMVINVVLINAFIKRTTEEVGLSFIRQ